LATASNTRGVLSATDCAAFANASAETSCAGWKLREIRIRHGQAVTANQPVKAGINR